jgi:Flp pilus assembly protein TadD
LTGEAETRIVSARAASRATSIENGDEVTAAIAQEQPKVGKTSVAMFVVGALAGLALGFPTAYGLLRETSAVPTTDEEARLASLISAGAQALNSDPDRALAQLLEAERLNPRNPTIQNNLCVALTALHHFDAAIVACNAAILLKDDFQLARNNLAWAKSTRDRAKATAAASKP